MMKKLQILIALCVFAFLGIESVAQTTIASQSFEGAASDNWSYTLSPPDGTFTSSSDYWRVASVSGFTTIPSDGSMAVEGQDITNGDNPNGDSAEIIFVSQDISAFTGVEITFDYELDGFDNGDALFYTLTLNGVTQTEVEIGATGTGRSEEVSFSIDVPDSANSVALTIRVKQNGTDQIGLDNFKLLGLAAGANAGPSITSISNTPAVPESTDAVTITADVTDADGVASVTLEYGFSTGVYDQTPIAMTNSTGDTYTASIAAQADGTTVFYRVVATDSNTTAATTNSAEQSYTVTDPVPAPSLIITEVADPGDVFQGRFVEIYNNGSTAIDFGTTEVHIAIQSNGGGISSTRLTGTLNAGSFYVIGNSSNIFDQYGITADLDYGTINGNGDDGYFLYVGGDENSGTLFDAYGVLNQNGSGEAWDYENSRAVRNSLADNPSATWQAASWTITAADVADMTPGRAESITFTYDNGAWLPNAPDGMIDPATSSDDILVVSGLVALSGNIDIRNITVQDGATLDLITNTVDLSITGDVTTTGTGAIFGPINSLNFAGVDQQELNADIAVTDLILNNANGLVLNGLVDVEGSLDLTNGVLTTNDNLTMKSSAGKSAVLLEVTSGSIAGNVTVEQFYPAQRAFRFVSSPVNMNGTIFSNWQQNGLSPGSRGYQSELGIQITGGDASNGFDQSTSNNPSAFTYDINTNSWSPLPATNDPTTSSLNAGDALRLYIRGDRSVSLNTAVSAGSDTRLVTTGTLLTGDIVVTDVNATDGGFTLLGNPYQAQIDLVALLSDATATNDINTNTFYVWDPTINPEGAYVAYNVSTGSSLPSSDVNQFIQPNQAFFISTNDDTVGPFTPSITFKELFKSSSSNTTAVYSTINDQEVIKLSLIAGSELNSGKARDGVVMQFLPDGNNSVDQFDAVKLLNPNENLFIDSVTSQLTISSMMTPIDGQEIQLGLMGLLEDTYTIKVDNSYNGSQNVYLNDSFLNENILLSNGVNLITRSFDLNNPDAINSSRFKLVFSDQTLSLDRASDSSLSVYPNPLGDSDLLHVSKIMSNVPLSVEVYSSNGQLLKSYENKSPNAQESLNIFTGLKKGVYLVALRQLNTVTTIKLIKK